MFSEITWECECGCINGDWNDTCCKCGKSRKIIPTPVSEMYDNDIRCIYGDDGFLKYYYKCDACGCIHILDYSEEESMNLVFCPVCYPSHYQFLYGVRFPFEFYTKHEINESIELKTFFESLEK